MKKISPKEDFGANVLKTLTISNIITDMLNVIYCMLRTVPTNSKVSLRGFMNMREK